MPTSQEVCSVSFVRNENNKRASEREKEVERKMLCRKVIVADLVCSTIYSRSRRKTKNKIGENPNVREKEEN